jgi:hypothetical protein
MQHISKNSDCQSLGCSLMRFDIFHLMEDLDDQALCGYQEEIFSHRQQGLLLEVSQYEWSMGIGKQLDI